MWSSHQELRSTKTALCYDASSVINELGDGVFQTCQCRFILYKLGNKHSCSSHSSSHQATMLMLHNKSSRLKCRSGHHRCKVTLQRQVTKAPGHHGTMARSGRQGTRWPGRKSDMPSCLGIKVPRSSNQVTRSPNQVTRSSNQLQVTNPGHQVTNPGHQVTNPGHQVTNQGIRSCYCLSVDQAPTSSSS